MSNANAIILDERTVSDFIGLTNGHAAIEMSMFIGSNPVGKVVLRPEHARELIQELTWRIEEIEKGAQKS